MLLLVVPAVCCVPLGEGVARLLPPAPLMVVVGILVLAGLAALQLLPRMDGFAGPVGAVAAGALSGFMNVTAGVGGPAVTLYAAVSRWEQKRFVGSIQLYFAVLNAMSVTAKGLLDLSGGQAFLLAAALVAGLLAGNRAVGLVPYTRARQVTLGLAAFGALATVAKGLAAL